ncbi:hypothetical protein CAPTEDRAFT_207591 [Capitella teleta]|uniref:Sulfotransferase domain-containing protein n=1 Tax=Capitella teleta TaxID=283909 RepID=R7TXY9_CAPTE|nr:hypothetical protein CAPTEDRAFT_207591 [Capitella teleta]|eukprot:ELT98497.1 hypothetical protein CAPTEDRAFT_207591 [Capitella teleta]
MEPECGSRQHSPPEAMHSQAVLALIRHVKYVHPCYVLKDEVSFYCLTKSEAWFVEALEGVEVWKSCFSPFHKIAQLEHAVNVIRMPLQSLYRLTNEMNDIEAKIVFIEFMARSGSTLFLQMFEETEECVTYSEPHYFNHYGRPEFADEDCRLEAVMKMYCKPRKLPTTAFVFKSILIGKTLSPAVHRLFPQAKFVYIYRNLIPNALSMDKINKKILFHRVDSAIRNIHPTIFWRMHKLIMNDMAFPYTENELDIAKKSDWSQGIIMYYYLLKVHAFYLQLQNRNDHPKTPSVKYEHLIKDPNKCLTAVFKHCDLSLALVPKALRALHKDSQRGSILAQETLNKREQDPRLVAKELLDIVEELAGEMGLNDLWGEFQLGHDVCDS